MIPPGPAGQVAAGATGGSWPCLGSHGNAGPLTVVCIDLGSNQGLAAFRESYSGPGAPTESATAYTADGVRRQLAVDLAADLENGTVALGLEGPCWGHADSPMGPYSKRPFETDTSAWPGRNGGPAALKAATVLGGVLEALLQLRRQLQVTFGLAGAPVIIGQPDTLWVWEAYVTGPYKGNTKLPRAGCEHWRREGTNRATMVDASNVSGHIADAFSAVRYGFANRPTPTNPEREGPNNTYLDVRPTVVPIIGPVLANANFAQAGSRSPRWNEPCLVVAPHQPGGYLMWP